MDSLMWSFSQEYNVKQQPSFKNFKTKVVKGGFQSDWKATPSCDSTSLVSKTSQGGNNMLINTMTSTYTQTFQQFDNIKPRKNKKQKSIITANQPLQIPKSNQTAFKFHPITTSTCSNSNPHGFQQFNMLVTNNSTSLDYSPTNLSSLSGNTSSVSNQSPTDFESTCSVQNSPKISNETFSKIEKPNKMKKHNRTAISIRELLN